MQRSLSTPITVLWAEEIRDDNTTTQHNIIMKEIHTRLLGSVYDISNFCNYQYCEV